MENEKQTGEANRGPPQRERGARPVWDILFPSRQKLHACTRLAFAAALNLLLGAWVLPQVGHVADPDYSSGNAFWACVEVGLPCAALLALLPVVLFGRDIPRLLALGLSFLPAYVAVAGFGTAFSLWLGGG
jgi:hypothetical protein